MSKFNSYYDFMEKYELFYKTVLDAEEEKLNALLSNNLSRIEASLSAYQSYIKQTQQFEEKRIELCRFLGFKSMAFSDIISDFSNQEKQKLILQKNRLEAIVKLISYLNRKSLEISEIQLKFVEELAEKSPENLKFYNSKGKSDSTLRNSNLLNKQA